MNPPYKDILDAVARETFENMAFLLVMDDEGDFTDNAARPAPAIGAKVSFAGPASGEVYLTVSAEALPALTNNMLGTEDALDGSPSATPDQQTDALKELLNVVCGNLLPRLAGTQAVFDVHAPQILDVPRIPETSQNRPPVAATNLSLDAGASELALFMNEDLSAGECPATSSGATA
jgi:CheY-specific phosphatase CheX